MILFVVVFPLAFASAPSLSDVWIYIIRALLCTYAESLHFLSFPSGRVTIATGMVLGLLGWHVPDPVVLLLSISYMDTPN